MQLVNFFYESRSCKLPLLTAHAHTWVTHDYIDVRWCMTILGTLRNLDDEPSGRRPEVFSRSRQLLRVSVMLSTWRSGRILVPRTRCFLVTWSWNEGLWKQPLPNENWVHKIPAFSSFRVTTLTKTWFTQFPNPNHKTWRSFGVYSGHSVFCERGPLSIRGLSS